MVTKSQRSGMAGELVTALSVDTPALPSPFHHCAECRHELQIEVRLHVHLRLYKADSGNFNLVCLLRAQSQFSVIVIGIGFKHNYVLGVRTVRVFWVHISWSTAAQEY